MSRWKIYLANTGIQVLKNKKNRRGEWPTKKSALSKVKRSMPNTVSGVKYDVQKVRDKW